jgi:tetratricopeptide (TPR) repeat protein
MFMAGGDSYAAVFRAIATEAGAIAIVGLILYNAVSAFALLGVTRFVLRSGRLKLLGSSLITSALWIVGLSTYLVFSGLHGEIGDGILNYSRTTSAPKMNHGKRTYGSESNLSSKFTPEQKWLEASAQLQRDENWHGLYDLSLEWRARELNSPYAWNTAGLAYYGLGDNIRAMRMFERALSLAPESAMIKQNLEIARETFERQGTKNVIFGKGSLAAD